MEMAVVRSVPLLQYKQPHGYPSTVLVPTCIVLIGTGFPPVFCVSAKSARAADVIKGAGECVSVSLIS